jgi:uncharacterized membrane protein YkoI
MKIRTLALTAIALSSATAFAMDPSPADRTLKLAEMVAQMESRYPGEVVAIQFDGSGDKRAHYHVDMRFPESGRARLDVDAVTLAIASRDPVPLTAGSATLAYSASLVSTYVPGQVIVAELDAFEGVAPHYDVDVRLPQGAIARLKVDPATRQIAWRNPAIVDQ